MPRQRVAVRYAIVSSLRHPRPVIRKCMSLSIRMLSHPSVATELTAAVGTKLVYSLHSCPVKLAADAMGQPLDGHSA